MAMAEMYYFSERYSDFIYFYRLISNFRMSLGDIYTEEVWEKFKDLFPKKYIKVYKELNQIKAIDVEHDINKLITMEHGHFVLTFPLVAIAYDMNGYIEENIDKMIITEQIYESTLDEIGVTRNDTYVLKKRKENLTTKSCR